MFSPEYKDWPVAHRRLLTAALLSPLLLALLAWLYILPKWHQYETILEEYRESQSRSKPLTWPRDAALLDKHLQECQLMLDGTNEAPGLKSLAGNSITHATSSFNSLIEASYPASERAMSMSLFAANASRIDYKYLANKIDLELQEVKRRLPSQMHSVDDKQEPSIYQRILHLWTLQAAMRIAIRHNLTLLANGDEMEAAVELLPVQSYVIEAADKEPYLLEFPVKLAMRGKMDDFLGFVSELQTDILFLPLKQLAIENRPPSEPEGGGDVVIEEQVFTVVCTSFFQQPPALPVDNGGKP